MNSGHWRRSKSMKLVNRGLETHIAMTYLPQTSSYRVTKIERMVGGIPTTTYHRIHDGEKAVTAFRELCSAAIEQEFEFPEQAGTKLINLTTVEEEE